MLYDKLMNPKGALTALMLSMLLTGSLSVEAARKKTVQKIKVACVGNSITYGTGIEDRGRPGEIDISRGQASEIREIRMAAVYPSQSGEQRWPSGFYLPWRYRFYHYNHK